MKTRLAVVAFMACACGTVQGQDYPCYIASLKLKDKVVEVRFNSKAYWYYTDSQLQLISQGKVRSSEEDGKTFVIADALNVYDGQRLDLWIPHISCQVRFQLTASPPGIYVTQSTSGVMGKSNTGEIFYPVPVIFP